jgi:very-short-patch-repair endonuclease
MARESHTPLDYARKLRKDMTDAERALWRLLRDRRMDGWRFRRQEPIDRFIVDVVCFEARLIIEVDGGQHYESESDRTRDAYLQSQGFRVLRLWNTDVLANRDGVYQVILTALARCAPDDATPSSNSAPADECPHSRTGARLRLAKASYPSPARGEGQRYCVCCAFWTLRQLATFLLCSSRVVAKAWPPVPSATK